jgi:hypothetical protein
MSLNHFTSQATPNPQLNPRFASLYVDGASQAGNVINPAPQAVYDPTSSAFQVIQNSWSGQIIALAQATANVQLILNPVATSAGVNFRFRVKATGDGTHTTSIIVHNSATVINGLATNGPSSVTQTTLAASTGVVASVNIAIGDWLDAECDGTNWWIKAASAVATGWVSA